MNQLVLSYHIRIYTFYHNKLEKKIFYHAILEKIIDSYLACVSFGPMRDYAGFGYASLDLVMYPMNLR